MLGVDGINFFFNLFGFFSLEHFVDGLMWQQWWTLQKRTEVENLGFPDLEEKWLLIYWFCIHREEGKIIQLIMKELNVFPQKPN